MINKITKTIIRCCCLGLLLQSCAFVDLSSEVKQLNAATQISGTITSDNKRSPIIVTLSRSDDNGKYPLHSYTVVYGTSDFFFSVPPGQYYLLAFEDRNQDFILQDNERVGWFGSPTLITTGKEQKSYSDITLTLHKPELAKKLLPTLYIPGKPRQATNLKKMNLGKVVSPSVFKAETGPLGMWQPVKFHSQKHTGIYFLEPYNENKIPVLFVHGISGSGYDWLYFLENLDREKFQPWVVQYPSGIRLGILSRSLSQSINELKATYNFKRLAVVAHSMGGLVSRGFINKQLASNNGDNIQSFITISTPWLGHNAANQGVKFAPVAVPSWFDMVPDSPYLTSLYKRKLPEHMQYHLFFSHKGKGGRIINGENSDGTVTLASQLSIKAQEQATKVIGYDEDHVSILSNHDLLTKVEATLRASFNLNDNK